MALHQWFSSIRSITSFLGQPAKAIKPRMIPRSGLGLLELEDRSVPSIVPITNITFDSVLSYSPIGVSADGNLVAFHTNVALDANDTNGRTDVYVKNISGNSYTLVSTKSDGTLTSAGAMDASMSADGRYVVFKSDAPDLVANDTNNTTDIFVKDMQTGDTALVSSYFAGNPLLGGLFTTRNQGVISGDGKYVAFHETNLVYVKTWNPGGTGTLTQVNKDIDGTVVGLADQPSISADGSKVAFRIFDTNISSTWQVYVKEWNPDGTGPLTLVSTLDGTTPMLGDCYEPKISADGNTVVFLASGTNGFYNVYAMNLTTGILQNVSTDSAGGLTDGLSMNPSISPDGNYVAFSSQATNLVPGDTNGSSDVFVKNLQTGAIARLSRGYNGESNLDSSYPTFSGDGKYVVFYSTATNLVPGDTNATLDLFRADNWFPTDLSLSNASVQETLPVGTLVGTLSSSDLNPSETFTYTLVAGTGDTDNVSFAISGNQLKTDEVFNYDTKTTYSVRVQTQDSVGNIFEKTFTISVTAAPTSVVTFASPNTTSVAENTTAVITVEAQSSDSTATCTYSINGGADATLFQIDTNTGELSFITPPDYEALGSAATSNTYEVSVLASDGTNAATQTITVGVTNVVEGPKFTSPNTASVPENTTAILTVAAITNESTNPTPTYTYSIDGGADAALFQIDANTGELSFITPPDYEALGSAASSNAYLVTVQASDGTNAATQTITVDVTNVVEGPKFTSSNTASVPENTTAVLTVAAITNESTNPTPTYTYSINSGLDATLFQIDANTGALSFITPPDFEAPGSAATSNTYDVSVLVSDGTNAATQTITVDVTNVVEGPKFTSPNTASVPENTTAILTVAAITNESTNPTPTYTYSIDGGADATLLQIDANTGALSFITPPDFEANGSAASSNTYLVTVQASDGIKTSQQDIVVTVTNVVDGLSFTSSNTASVPENTTAVMTVTAVTNESTNPTPIYTYSINSGLDAALFQIDANTGLLSFVTPPDYEIPGSAASNNTYTVIVEVSDGVGTAQQQITVDVTDVAVGPMITSPNTASVPENTTTVLTVAVNMLESVDPNAAPSYTINGGADASLFQIDANTGALSFITPPDYETPLSAASSNTYTVIVEVSDGANTTQQQIAISVTDVNETPTDITLSNASVASGAIVGSVVGTLSTADPDAGDTFTYSLINNAGGLFTLVDNAIQVNSPLNVNPVSTADITVRTTDSAGNTFDKIITITITNTPPTVENLADQTGLVGGKLGPITFEVIDNETLAPNLIVTVTSSNQSVLPDANIILGGQWYVRTVTLYPVQVGTATVTVTVKDGNGATTTRSFTVTSLAQWPGTYQEDFAGTGNLGPNWLIHTGSSVLDNNTALSTAPVVLATVYGLTQKDTVVQGTVSVGTNQTGSSSLVARYSGPSTAPSMYLGALVYYNGALHSRISKVVDGVATTLSETKTVPIAGQYDLRLEVVGDSLKLFVNGTLSEFAYDSSLSTAGLTGIRLTNGNRVGSFSANDIQLSSVGLPSSPTTTPVDEFTLADGAQLSRTWTDRVGNLSVQGTKLMGQGGKSNLSTLNLPVSTDVGAQADVQFTAPGQSVGIALRYSGRPGAADTNMYWGALQWISGTNQQAVIYRNVNGVWSLLASAQLTGTGGVLRFEATGPSLKLFVDGQRVLSAYDTALSAGLVGLRSGIGGTADNFYAYKSSDLVYGTSYSDTFDDNTVHQLSSTWSERAGGFTLESNNAQGTVAGANTAVLNGVSASDVVVTAVIQPQVDNLRAIGLVARYSGVRDDNMYWGALNVYSVGTETKYIAQIWKNVNGAWTCLNSNAVPIEVADAEGKELRFEVVGTSLKLFLGDRLYAFAHDSSIMGVGGVGIRTGSGASLDDFTYNVLNRDTVSVSDYTDPFDSGLNTRNVLSSDWQERSGFISVSTGRAVGGSASQPNSATLNGVNVENVTVSADLFFTAAGQTAQLIGRYSGRNGSGEDNMYLASLTTQVNGDLLVRLVKVVNGVTTELQRTTMTGYFTPGQYAAKSPLVLFLLDGSNLDVSIDGNSVLTRSDSDLTSGSVGIRMTAGAGIDNFHATTT